MNQGNPFLTCVTLTLIDPKKSSSTCFYFKSIQSLHVENILSHYTVILATAFHTYWARVAMSAKGKIPNWPGTQAAQSSSPTAQCCQLTELCELAWRHGIVRPLTCSYTVVNQLLPLFLQNGEKESVWGGMLEANKEMNTSFWNITWPWHRFRAPCQTHFLTLPPPLFSWFLSFFLLSSVPE